MMKQQKCHRPYLLGRLGPKDSGFGSGAPSASPNSQKSDRSRRQCYSFQTTHSGSLGHFPNVQARLCDIAASRAERRRSGGYLAVFVPCGTTAPAELLAPFRAADFSTGDGSIGCNGRSLKRGRGSQFSECTFRMHSCPHLEGRTVGYTHDCSSQLCKEPP